MSTKWDFYSFFFTLSSSSEALSSESLRSSFISFPFSKPVRAIYGENIEKFEKSDVQVNFVEFTLSIRTVHIRLRNCRMIRRQLKM